jgi:hypothetical protein
MISVLICFTGQGHHKGFSLFGWLCKEEFEVFEIIITVRESKCGLILEGQGSNTSCSPAHPTVSCCVYQ